jgi:hypothetical protein
MVDLYRGYNEGLLTEDPTRFSDMGVSGPDFLRGMKYTPFDFVGAPVDLLNMGLQGIDAMYGQRNVLGSERPFLGSEDLINRYADLGGLMGVNYDRPTGSGSETLGRVAGGILAPTVGARTVGRVVDAGADYIAGAPARVADRARSVTLGSGIDPTAALDDLIVRGMGDNGGPAMQVEAPASPVRDIDDLGFYSQALEAAQNLPQAKGTGQQIEKMLINAGVKPDEIAFTPGLRGLLDQPQVTQDEVVGLLEGNRIRPQETVLQGGSVFDESQLRFGDPEVMEPDYDYDISGRVDDLMYMFDPDDIRSALIDSGFDEEYASTLAFKSDNANYPDETTSWADRLTRTEQSEIESAFADQAKAEYYEEPRFVWRDPDTDYEIRGNDNFGYEVYNSSGDPVRGEAWSFEEARVLANDAAYDAGDIGVGRSGEARFDEEGWVEAGGTNYRENLLQIPKFEGMTKEFVKEGHFEQPNIAVHSRTKDRNSESGVNDVLYVEELQSDWGQTGRKVGFEGSMSEEEFYRLSRQMDEYRPLMRRYTNEIKDYLRNHFGEGVEYTYNDIRDLRRKDDKLETMYQNKTSAEEMYNKAYRQLDRDQPQKGPLVGNSEKFAEAGIKRLLIQAANEGKGYVSFSSGELQADRWNNPGLEVYYDKIIPNVAKKVVKRFDKDAFTGSKYIEDLGDRFTIEITPKMREAIKKGVPLFSAGGAGLLGAGMAREEQPQPTRGIL